VYEQLSFSCPHCGNNVTITVQGNPVFKTDLLTKREKQVFSLLTEGLTSNQIAHKLSRCKRTIDTHRVNIKQKLGIQSSRIALLQYGMKGE